MIQETIPQRHLAWEGYLNVRDLGGRPRPFVNFDN
jgi:hypothetical protein